MSTLKIESNKLSFPLAFIVVSVFVFLSDWIQKENYVNFPSGIRHIVIFFFFLTFFLIRRTNASVSINFLVFFLLLVTYSGISFFYSSAPALNFFLGFFFTFLFLIVFWFASKTRVTIDELIRIFKYLIVFVFVMSIGPVVQGLVNGSTLRWLPGLFREVGAFGTSMNIATILSLTLFLLKKDRKYIYLALFFSFGIVMTILKKTMISNIFVWFFYFFFASNDNVRIKSVFWIIVFVFISIGMFGNELFANFQENQEYLDNVGVEEHVRLGMYLASFNIALDYFPFGSGFGTFGSLASIVNGYSPLYFDYNIDVIGSNSPEDVAKGHHTLLDTYWPHIIAELGFLGSLLFLYFWIIPSRFAFKRLLFSSDRIKKAFSFFTFLMVITISWEGVTLYTPETPIFIMLNSGLVGLCFNYIKY